MDILTLARAFIPIQFKASKNPCTFVGFGFMLLLYPQKWLSQISLWIYPFLSYPHNKDRVMRYGQKIFILFSIKVVPDTE